MIGRLALVLILVANVAVAEAPLSSLRPIARGGAASGVAAAVATAVRQSTATARAPVRSLRPQARASLTRSVQAAVAVAVADAARSEPAAPAPSVLRVVPVSATAIGRSARPVGRSAAVIQAGQDWAIARARGQVCGDPDLQGEPIGYVDGNGACGIEDAVRLRSVMGVRLSQAATIDCQTAVALKTWVGRSVRPALGSTGGGLASLRVAAHYACRGRNNQANARLSEHAFGRAIDISGFILADGQQITVLEGWGSRSSGDELRRMRQGACGPFSTVLGPGSDRYHSDHFHLDTARGRGDYCR